MVRGIRLSCRDLKLNPESGERCEQAAPDIRRCLHRGYGIYYRIDAASKLIWIVRVLHPSIEFEKQDFDRP